MQTFFIYALCEPGSDVPMYVGATTSAPLRRLSGHISEATNPRFRQRTRKRDWIRSLVDRGMRPDVFVLAESRCEAEEIGQIEASVIEQWRAANPAMTNERCGGGGAWKKDGAALKAETAKSSILAVRVNASDEANIALLIERERNRLRSLGVAEDIAVRVTAADIVRRLIQTAATEVP